MQVLLREQKSNVKEKEVKEFESIIRGNDEFIAATNKHLNAIKDLATRKKYYLDKIDEFAEALEEVADKRKDVVKKGLDVEKAKNKMIEGEKLQRIDQELNDIQREFDRARDVLLKKIEQFQDVRKEINNLWIKLKDTTAELS
jgi:predicted transcriptional regulator